MIPPNSTMQPAQMCNLTKCASLFDPNNAPNSGEAFDTGTSKNERADAPNFPKSFASFA